MNMQYQYMSVFSWLPYHHPPTSNRPSTTHHEIHIDRDISLNLPNPKEAPIKSSTNSRKESQLFISPHWASRCISKRAIPYHPIYRAQIQSGISPRSTRSKTLSGQCPGIDAGAPGLRREEIRWVQIIG